MKIALAGTGNVATVLGRLFSNAGHEIISVWGRDAVHAKTLADELGAIVREPGNDADLIIISVSDDAIGKIFPGKKFNVPVVHTAGSVPSDVLKEHGPLYGVLYPLQSLRKEMKFIPEIPFLISGSNDTVCGILEELCKSVSSSVNQYNDGDRLRLHLAAVLVSNFTNHMYHLAEKFCERSHIDFKMLQPLIEETATRVRNIPPSKLQTGPAVRRDTSTIDKHLKLLENDNDLRKVYEFMTKSIQGD